MAQLRAQWAREMESLRTKPEIVTAQPGDETLSFMEEDTRDETTETLRGGDESYRRRSSDLVIVDSEADEMSDYI